MYQAPLTEFPVGLDVVRDKGGSVCAFEIPAEFSDAAEYPAARFGAAKAGAGVCKLKDHASNFARTPFRCPDRLPILLDALQRITQ